MKDPSPSLWTMDAQKSVFRCPIFQIFEKKYTHPVDHRSGNFYVMDTADWVQVVAFTPEKRFILVQQFRFGTEALSLETPGGLVEPNEDPLAAGLRELREETGYVPKNAYLLASVRPNPALQNNRLHIVIAENCQKVAEQRLDPNEEMICFTATFIECLEKIKSGAIDHAIAISALLMYYGNGHF
jgi:ADP-ribose pyrophosphatase YjhB (NUDIX family)